MAYKVYRDKVLAHYGAFCRCCDESTVVLLTLDHINNDGGVHRKTVKDTYRWVVENHYPDTFQILCWNCNLGKHLNKGKCPHTPKIQKPKEENYMYKIIPASETNRVFDVYDGSAHIGQDLKLADALSLISDVENDAYGDDPNFSLDPYSEIEELDFDHN